MLLLALCQSAIPANGALGTLDMTSGAGKAADQKCPDYWGGGDNYDPGDAGHEYSGLPREGDPELGFCRRYQLSTGLDKPRACCTVMHDDDVAEEFSDLTGGGEYSRAHVLLQQYFCLVCHHRISCLIDERPNSAGERTLQLPRAFGLELVGALHMLDKSGLWLMADKYPLAGGECPTDPAEKLPDGGDFRAKQTVVPSVWFGAQSEADRTGKRWVRRKDGGISVDENSPWTFNGSETNMEAVRQMLLAIRPPGLNQWDGFPVNISWTEGDECGFLAELLPGSGSGGASARRRLGASVSSGLQWLGGLAGVGGGAAAQGGAATGRTGPPRKSKRRGKRKGRALKRAMQRVQRRMRAAVVQPP